MDDVVAKVDDVAAKVFGPLLRMARLAFEQGQREVARLLRSKVLEKDAEHGGEVDGKLVAPVLARAATAAGLAQALIRIGWEFRRNLLMRHVRFSPQLGEKPRKINVALRTSEPPH